jgi:hypothetical protein
VGRLPIGLWGRAFDSWPGKTLRRWDTSWGLSGELGGLPMRSVESEVAIPGRGCSVIATKPAQASGPTTEAV